MTNISEWLSDVSGVVASLTIIFTFYYQFIKKPQDKKREIKEAKLLEEKQKNEEEHQRKMREIVSEKNKPLNETLKNILEETEGDRRLIKELSHIADQNIKLLTKQDERLDQFDIRLTVLETLSDVYNGMNTKKENNGKELK